MRRTYFLIAIAVLVAFLCWQFPYAMSGTDEKMRLAYLSLWGILISGSALLTRNLPLSHIVRNALVWILVIGVLTLAYSYKDAFLNTRLAAELLPNRARIGGDGSISLRASADGHFYVEANVNGAPVNFLIDTGASDVMLNKEDARRIGLDPETLSYTRTYGTANGPSGGAPIELKRLQIGPFTLDDFPASVGEGDTDHSLLGMTALRRLGGFRIEGEDLIIGGR